MTIFDIRTFGNWGGNISEMFKIAAGVRQGRVLSHLSFAIYVGDIIVNLKSSDFGCYFGGEYIGVLMYADDLLTAYHSYWPQNNSANMRGRTSVFGRAL